ncbi:uncharacterized protein LOC133291282 [Gastrolobium bilobum]|uniref:uncharacterized protein LOC133291282 n=1 Tax=Gastrolobium bilobum TaxID=150636 RepID=UPI002AAF657E|nr:uncharacterized protein LOC133291282 [Gastrolobium bilobum]
MESESERVKQKMEVLDILKEAVTIYVTNINFIVFTFLTSLPFYCVMVYFEILFQKTMVETPEIISLLPFYEKYQGYTIIEFYSDNDIPVRSFSKDCLPVLIQLGFIYLVPLHVLELCSAVVTMDLASTLRSEEHNMSLKQMFQKSIDMTLFKVVLCLPWML